jgi:hypothetical protein
MSARTPSVPLPSAQSGCLPTLLFVLGSVLIGGLLVKLSIIDNTFTMLIVLVSIGYAGFVMRMRISDAALARMPSAEDLLLADQRQPVLYLRSFETDLDTHPEGDMLEFDTVLNPLLLLFRAIYKPRSFEQKLASIVSQVGPFVALGPPSFGAARFHSVGSNWQAHVQKYLGQSKLIIVRVGETRGLRWELEELFRMGILERLIIMLQFPGLQDKPLIEARYRQFSRWFGPLMRVDLPQKLGGNRYLSFPQGHAQLAETLTGAMLNLGLDVERFSFATLKGLLRGVSDSVPKAVSIALPKSKQKQK